MLKGADTESFPVIDLGDYVRASRGRSPMANTGCGG
jgi:hypothetical protein